MIKTLNSQIGVKKILNSNFVISFHLFRCPKEQNPNFQILVLDHYFQL